MARIGSPSKWPFCFVAFAAGAAGGVVAGESAWVALGAGAVFGLVGLLFWHGYRTGLRSVRRH